MWITPITDRTQSDVYNKTPKGYLNISDLNRIEGNIKVLSDILHLGLTVQTWSYDTLVTKTRMQNILNNINAIKNAWQAAGVDDTPALPINNIDKVNTIEKILLDTYKSRIANEKAYIYCGYGYCGQEIGVI